MRSPHALLFAAILLACRPVATHQVSPANWSAIRAALPVDADSAATSLEALRARSGIPIIFWASATTDTVAYQVTDGPCGLMGVAVVKTLIDPPDSLSSDLAVELDSLGHELARWTFPANETVVGIRGETILAPLDDDDWKTVALLAIDTAGRFRVVSKSGWTPDAPEYFDCPPVAAFRGSDFVVCRRFVDPVSGLRRRVAYQTTCT